jgi:hypothetical protein
MFATPTAMRLAPLSDNDIDKDLVPLPFLVLLGPRMEVLR